MQLNYAPPAPLLVPHEWPIPGLTPEESAQSCLSNSAEFADVIAATFFAHGADGVTQQQLKHLLPRDWLDVLGRFAHADLAPWQAEQRGMECKYVGHDGGVYAVFASSMNAERYEWFFYRLLRRRVACFGGYENAYQLL